MYSAQWYYILLTGLPYPFVTSSSTGQHANSDCKCFTCAIIIVSHNNIMCMSLLSNICSDSSCYILLFVACMNFADSNTSSDILQSFEPTQTGNGSSSSTAAGKVYFHHCNTKSLLNVL